MSLLAVSVLVGWLPLAAQVEDDREATLRDAERILTKAGLATDGPALLAFFKARTLAPEKEQEIQELIVNLGAKKFQKREVAAAKLLEIGVAVRGPLRRAVLHLDPEIGKRAERILQKMPANQEQGRAIAALQLLAQRKPNGAAAVLLGYLPFIADDQVLEEARAALPSVTVNGGKPEPAVLAALTDPLDLKRSTAAEALCRVGVQEHLPAALKVAQALPPALRLPVALALVDGQNKAGVPWLIDLLTELPTQDIWRAEEMLYRVAGDQSPGVTVGRTVSAAKAQALWRAWWLKHGAVLDLARLAQTPRLLGYTLIAQADNRSAMGRVFELGPDQKKVLWEIDQLRYPVDVQVTGPNRVLIAEYLNRRVTERDFTGKVLWEYAIDLPIACQRLPNGHTFIATRRQLVEVNRDGKEVYSYHPPTTSISAAKKLRNGQVVLVIGTQCQRLEAGTNKVLHSFPVGLVYNLAGNIDVLPNGHVLVPEYLHHQVAEYDAEGKICSSIKVQSPTSVVRLANGHTLVVCLLQQRVLEYDRNGTEVNSFNTNGRPWRVRRR